MVLLELELVRGREPLACGGAGAADRGARESIVPTPGMGWVDTYSYVYTYIGLDTPPLPAPGSRHPALGSRLPTSFLRTRSYIFVVLLAGDLEKR